MKKPLCWIVLVSLVAFAPLAAATTYQFTSPTYTFASGSYTTAMRLTGTLTTAVPLPPNMPYSSVEPLATSWSFFDGLVTYTNLNTSDFEGFFVATDANGDISQWGLDNLTPAAPNTVGEIIDVVYIAQSGGGAAGGYHATCVAVSGAGVCNAYTALYLGIVEGSSGSWATVRPPAATPAPVADPLALGLLALLMVALACRAYRYRI
jgi:hypothetical protein